MSTKVPETCKGMRDFTSPDIAKRRYMFHILQKHFELFGFQPLETPTMENLSTLTGKYGDEGDQLLFKVLASGDYLKEAKTTFGHLSTQEIEPKTLLPLIADKGLRYDLTIPFARFVAKNYRELPLPFKRYQMQPVWRADRPQKGRYREFYQCDADIIGSTSLENEKDLLMIYDHVFSQLGLPVRLKLNNRKILTAFSEVFDAKEYLVPMTVALDKYDKIGKEAVLEEMRTHGLTEESLHGIARLLDNLMGSYTEKIAFLETLFVNSSIGKEGLFELKEVYEGIMSRVSSTVELEFDMILARGLSYYTGSIYEVKAREGSLQVTIAAGGRYDNLTGVFGVEGLGGVGISFGVDRIFDVMDDLGLFPEQLAQKTKVLFAHFDEQTPSRVYPLLFALRKEGIASELYPDAVKLKKQLQYADQKQVMFVAMIGEEEMNTNSVLLRDLSSGSQENVPQNVFIKRVKEML